MKEVKVEIERDWLFDREQRINECEGLAALFWITTVGPAIQGSDVLLGVDSAAAGSVLINAYARTPMLAMIAGSFWSWAASYNLAIWITLVPSHLNPSDGFSRGDDSLGQTMGWARVEPSTPSAGRWRFLRHAFK